LVCPALTFDDPERLSIRFFHDERTWIGENAIVFFVSFPPLEPGFPAAIKSAHNNGRLFHIETQGGRFESSDTLDLLLLHLDSAHLFQLVDY